MDNQEQNLETNLKVNQIPLKIKPVKSPKKNKKKSKQKSSKETKLKIFSSIKIIFVIILLIVNTFLIINIAIKIDTNKSVPTNIQNEISNKVPENSSVLGSWMTTKESLFSFKDDYTFYWYDSYYHKEDNYYSGTYSYKNGEAALNEMGYSIEEAKLNFGDNIKIENIYSINMIPIISYKAGLDTTKKDITTDEEWWFILVIKNDKTAIAYNKTLDLRYSLTKV